MKSRAMKRILSLVCVLTMAISCNLTLAYAWDEAQPAFAITDEVVIIDSVSYEIQNNTIQYRGLTYTVEENYTLSRYDENGDKVIFLLPVEQKRVTDPKEIARLNAAVAELERQKALARAIPSDAVSLPYSENVPEGQWLTMTPAFDIIIHQLIRTTNLKLSNFPLTADRRFQIIFSVCDPLGNWTSDTIPLQDFLYDSDVRYDNTTISRYGMFTITNLYGDPSPSYTYEVFLTMI